MALCGCKRSPTGKCIGWHSLSEEEYQKKKVEWTNRQKWEKEEARKKAARKQL
jgi:hypothetical protein